MIIVKLLVDISIRIWYFLVSMYLYVIYDYFQNDHSAKNSPVRHAGDLGNIITSYGYQVTGINFGDEVITLGDGGVRDVADRAIVVHAGEDDLGLGVGEKAVGSKKTGNAGARVACGIIKLIK